MVNGTRSGFSLSLSLSLPRGLLSTVRVYGVRFPRASVRATLAALAFCRLPRPRRSVDRSYYRSLPIFPLPGSAWHGLVRRIPHAYRSIRKTRPVDRRTVAHSHGLPLRGRFSSLGSSAARACGDATRWFRCACERARASHYVTLIDFIHRFLSLSLSFSLSLSLFLSLSLAVYNKPASRVRIMPSYWK